SPAFPPWFLSSKYVSRNALEARTSETVRLVQFQTSILPFGKNRSIVHARSSRNNLVPTSPSSSLTSKCQNIEGISVDQRLPEGPLIKTSGRGNNLYIFYETNVGILPFRRLLHAPVEINVLTHVERFIVTKQGSVNVSTAKSC